LLALFLPSDEARMKLGWLKSQLMSLVETAGLFVISCFLIITYNDFSYGQAHVASLDRWSNQIITGNKR
jgi:hypothetical protein